MSCANGIVHRAHGGAAVAALSLVLAVSGLTWRAPAARAETMQSCRRRGCRLNINTYRCICPQRPRHRARVGVPRIRCPRGANLTVRKSKPRYYKRLWGTLYRCVRRRGGREIAHGPVMLVRFSGVLRFRGENRNGKAHGVWKSFDHKGTLWESQPWVGGKRHGVFTSWHERGQKKEEGRWQRGLRVGLWKQWHKTGQLKGLGTYTENKKSGVWTWWHPNGKKRMHEPFTNGHLQGVRKHWDSTGKLVETMEYVKDRRHGRYWSLRRGYKEVATYRRGMLHGTSRSWHPNGKLRGETSYYRGLATGLDRRWSPKGVLLRRRQFLNGRLHGLSERWYDNGKERETGRYLQGRRVGRWIQYGPDGSLLSSYTYPPPP